MRCDTPPIPELVPETRMPASSSVQLTFKLECIVIGNRALIDVMPSYGVQSEHRLVLTAL